MDTLALISRPLIREERLWMYSALFVVEYRVRFMYPF